MYEEPSAYEYANMISQANKTISTDDFKCIHNNTGWLGYYITTPNGNKYQLVEKGTFTTGYNLHEHSLHFSQLGKPLGLEFKDLDECKNYLLDKENEVKAINEIKNKAIDKFAEQLKSSAINEWDFSDDGDYDAMYRWIDVIAEQMKKGIENNKEELDLEGR